MVSVQNVLDRVGPLSEIKQTSFSRLQRRLRGFKHRFTTGDEVAGLLYGAGEILRDRGSLGEFVRDHIDDSQRTVIESMTAFASALVDGSKGRCRALVSDPGKGSACKRLNLYFRWMVRRDAVDPGGWAVAPNKLIVPLDTHMHRFALRYGLTARRAADLKTAVEITDGFRKFCPEDPVKYDFALTRIGILKTAGFEVVSLRQK